jgi:tetratricopeptide (TPR) repeat protein
MKKIIVMLAMVIANFALEAQVKTPQASPKSTSDHMVGLTNVALDYSRPSTKGRVIFGDLVPFGKLWRTGANANSIVSGKYSIFTVPKADVWEVILYKTIDNWGNPETWNEANVAVRASVKPVFLDHKVESFTLSIGNITNDNAQLEISWENTFVALKFEVPTQKTAIASINKVLAGPGAGDYFSAGQYYFQSNGDMNKALEYVNKAISMNKEGEDVPFWYLRQKSLIQAKLGDKVGAIASAKLSLAAAEKAKNDDYVKMNKDSIAEWSKK